MSRTIKKTVWITGSSRGIGRAIAIKMAELGHRIVIHGVENVDKLRETEKVLHKYIPKENIMAIQGDVGDFKKVQELYKTIENRFGGVDILVNNAGVSYIGLFQDMAETEWNQVINTNLKGVIHTSHTVLPYMVSKKEGKIINISSIWGQSGASCEALYSMTKGGVDAFTKALAKELAPSSVQVNAIACGVIDTEMNQFLSAEERTALIEDIPAMRFGRVEEVAELVSYLAGDGTDYLTGQVITMDGGYL